MFRRAMVVGALATVVASAHAQAAHEKVQETVIKSRDFSITGGQCSIIPQNLEIRGLGLERTQTVVEGVRDHEQRGPDDEEEGVSYSLSSRITGTATDNAGGQYRFVYQLTFTKPIVLPGAGIITDRFTLSGTGMADGLSTFFRARVTLDSGSNPIGFELLEQSGDLRCDPL